MLLPARSGHDFGQRNALGSTHQGDDLGLLVAAFGRRFVATFRGALGRGSLGGPLRGLGLLHWLGGLGDLLQLAYGFARRRLGGRLLCFDSGIGHGSGFTPLPPLGGRHIHASGRKNKQVKSARSRRRRRKPRQRAAKPMARYRSFRSTLAISYSGAALLPL